MNLNYKSVLLAALLQKLGLALAVWTSWPDTVFTL